ncbi:MAG: 3-oxoacyl-[acyl-carrier-protein] synthase III C-terminal domain-containing protein [Nostocales cyanobacterium 94392]|nr:3-oxoacyl-[acyl-carrier-protein] synthase III C-terminal domain-containing protein [Nostocales cyanobacterium 94392]
MANIVATSIGFPENYYTQEVLATALKKYLLAMDLEFDLETIDRFFTNVKINGRYFTFPLDSLYDPPKFAEVSNQAIVKCVNLIETTVTKLLDKAGIAPQDVSQLTGTTLLSATPGLDARLMNRIPFSTDIKRMPLTGVGCMGGAFGLARVADYLKGHKTESSVLFAMEPSSSLWQGSLQRDLSYMIKQLPEDPAIYTDIIMTIVTAALFGDGSAAVLMVGEDHPLAQPGQPRIVDSRSIILHNTVHLMGMDLVETGTRNILRPEVADYIKIALHKTVDPLLAEHNLSIDNIDRWMVHPGGPKIISAVEEEFGLDEQILQGSWDALAEIGNISSPTVLYILDKSLAEEQPPAGSYGLLLAMGPGFCQEAILLQW